GAIQRLGPSTVRLSLIETAPGANGTNGTNGTNGHMESGLFEGVDTSLAPGLERYGALIDSARSALAPRTMRRVADLLLRALAELRRNGPADFRAAKEPPLEDAILAASGIVVDPS